MKRYLVLLLRTPRFDAALIGPHRDYVEALRARGQLELSGGFSDASGGAYLLRADSLDAARALVDADPLIVHQVSTATLYEWNAA
jgi:uncharacterized protein YciI